MYILPFAINIQRMAQNALTGGMLLTFSCIFMAREDLNLMLDRCSMGVRVSFQMEPITPLPPPHVFRNIKGKN